MDYTDIKIKLYVKMKSNTKIESALQFILHMSQLSYIWANNLGLTNLGAYESQKATSNKID